MSWVLPATAGLPALAALVLVLLPRRTADRSAAGIGMLAALASFGCAVAAAVAVGTGGARPDLVTDVPWVPQLGLRFHLGIDGHLAAAGAAHRRLGVLVAVHTFTERPDRARAYVICLLLVLEAGALGTFLSLDLVLFFVFFEVVLVPMWFLIAGWGGVGRRRAANRFIL